MATNGLVALLLIALLDSNSFWARQEAQSELYKMDIVALPYLMLCDKTEQSIEPSVRIERLLNRFNSNLVDYICNRKPPYIDSIPMEGIEGLCCSYWDRNEI